MRSQKLGKNISEVEILNISVFGIWIYVKGKEYFLDFENYPWFQNAKISQILNVELLHNNHLSWPDLDIDLDVEILETPEKYPLVYK
ncbi:MAG: hypothetical protein A3F16_03925 [Deltaproteobacteria bacterium RIFCSPHIGHO2_12_FULL_43_9]|nr:MAG: hypothetical protein A3F16_03925 [Deltaproteobacteria bacterium RIFCSPHIGHO2_12_FULL_43_9]